MVRPHILAGIKHFDEAVRLAVFRRQAALFFTLGKNRRAVANRILLAAMSCERARIEGPKKMASRISRAPLFFVPRSGLSVLEIWHCARRVETRLRNEGQYLRRIVIEDLQRIRGRSRREMLNDLRIMAREMKVPIITPSTGKS